MSEREWREKAEDLAGFLNRVCDRGYSENAAGLASLASAMALLAVEEQLARIADVLESEWAAKQPPRLTLVPEDPNG
jgi:hypothetical protein